MRPDLGFPMRKAPSPQQGAAGAGALEGRTTILVDFSAYGFLSSTPWCLPTSFKDFDALSAKGLLCEACNKDVPVVLIDMHSCSLDSKIRMTLEAQVVEKTVEVNKTERKRPAASAASKAVKRAKEDLPKRKRSPTAFFLFMEDFRKEYKAAHPDNKSVAAVAKEGGEKWRSMTEEEKKPYIDKAAELKAHVDNGEGSGENNVAVEKGEVADDEEEQEVDQPASGDDGQETSDQEDERNELDDDI